MQESDIARKCTATLIGIALLVCSSVLASWWIASSNNRPAHAAAPALKPSTNGAEKSGTPSAVSAARPLAYRPVSDLSRQTPLPDPDDPVRELERKTVELEKENARLRGRLDDMISWLLENVRGTYPLPEGQMANLRVVPLDEAMTVSADLAELLRLNEDEMEQMDSAFVGTRDILMELEGEQIQVKEPEGNQVVLNIPPYGEDGQIVREELYRELQQTLGTARFSRFLEVSEAELNVCFEYFGDVDRTLEFEPLADDGSGIDQLYVRDERIIPNPDDPYRADILASERIVTELPSEYLPYADWLPETVTRFSAVP